MKKVSLAGIGLMFIMMLSINLQAQFHMLPPEGENTQIDLNEGRYSTLTFDKLMAQFEGKVVYLDFWASWCGPCKREMPYSAKLKKTFEGKDVVFVYISTDRNPTAWDKAIKSMQIGGTHYRVNKSVYVGMNERFNVKTIPRYVLFDKDGNVVDDNAKRPSNPQLVDDINALL